MISETYVDQPGVVALFEIVQNAGFVQVSQASHVLCLLELRGVHLLGLARIKGLLLRTNQQRSEVNAQISDQWTHPHRIYANSHFSVWELNGYQFSLLGLDLPSFEAFLLVAHPHPFLGVERLGLLLDGPIAARPQVTRQVLSGHAGFLQSPL